MKQDPVAKVFRISKAVKALTEQDFYQLESIAERQAGYFSPLRNATMNKQHNLGDHNQQVIDTIRKLKSLFTSLNQTNR